jgi:hypothetical protein
MSASLAGARRFVYALESPAYGLTPFAFAPAPASRWRDLFAEEETRPTSTGSSATGRTTAAAARVELPNEAARGEWRAFETLQAVRALSACGRSTG